MKYVVMLFLIFFYLKINTMETWMLLLPIFRNMMLPVIPRKAMIGTYQCTDNVACDPQEGNDWQNNAIEGRIFRWL